MINNGQFKILPRVLLVQIFKELSLTDLLKMEIQNKYFRDLIQNTKWDHFMVKLQSINKIKIVIKKYNFMKYDFSNSLITDEIVKELRNCHTLNLNDCNKITDESVKELRNCHTLDLSYFIAITEI